MTDLNTNVKGWLDRRETARSKQAHRNSDDKQAIRAERERMYQEQAEAGRQAAREREARLEAEMCQCTACGGTGRLTITKAMGVVEAMDRYGFGGYQPSKHAINALAHIARGEDAPPGSRIITFTYGSISPAPGRPESPTQPVETIAPQTDPARLDNVPQKPSKAKVKAVETTHDGFLIDSD